MGLPVAVTTVSGEPATVRVGRALARRLPSVVSALSPAYFRYLSLAADRHAAPPDVDARRAPGAPEHVLVVCVDALRPDAVPAVGLDATTAVTPGTWTFPAVTSLHTGLYPHEHGAVARKFPGDDHAAVPEQSDATTLPAALAAAGYDTYCGVAFLTPFLAVRGWYGRHRVYDHVRAGRVVEDYRDWRAGRDATFAYLHLGDLHALLDPPAEYVERRGVDTGVEGLADVNRFRDSYDGRSECRRYREHRLRLYRAALDYVEDVLAPLVAAVRGDTLVVVCGDHGEAHFEHYELDRRISDSRPNYGLGHGGTPFDAVARVPVAASSPSGSLTPSGGWPSLVDVPRTVAGRVLDGDPFPGGRDWNEPVPPWRVAVCEATRYGVERKAAYMGPYKVVRSPADGVTLAATVSADGEDFDAHVPADVREHLVDELPPFEAGSGATRETGRMVEGQLEALGYA